MSWVSNVILHFTPPLDGDGDEAHTLEQINEFFSLVPKKMVLKSSFFSAEDASKPQYMYPARRGFVSVHDASLPRGWYGGSKHLECSLAIGAFNGLDIGELVEHLCNLCVSKVLDPARTQLILKDQEDDKFHMINIDEEMEARGMRTPEPAP